MGQRCPQCGVDHGSRKVQRQAESLKAAIAKAELRVTNARRGQVWK